MRILIVGAGGVGGYFGGRLLQGGADVTFLVRERRQKQLAANGLVIKSVTGDFQAPAKTVMAGAIAAPYDLIILSCKAYSLDDAIASVTPAVGPQTSVIPLLNGMRHLDLLNGKFGAERILGGMCAISTSLTPEGVVKHLNDVHLIVFGEQKGGVSERTAAVAKAMAVAPFQTRVSEAILQDMWEKWTFLATLASANCLLRANVGEIMAAGGKEFVLSLFEEVRAIAAANGHPQSETAHQQALSVVTNESSAMAASMLRDLESGGPVEAAHVIGDLIARGQAAGMKTPLLSIAYLALKSYEARRERRPA